MMLQLALQCCADVAQDLLTSELTDDVVLRLAALHIVQRYHDDCRSSRQHRRLSVRNIQLANQTVLCCSMTLWFSYDHNDFFVSVTLTLTWWPWYIRVWPILKMYLCIPKMKFLGQGLQKLEHRQNRHTDIRDRTHYHTTLASGRRWNSVR